ncbi:ROK family protein [Pseudactinotalea sp. Z1732]|uniref:ROK family protein n=1 Tax=Micrococcales TaxID=85006 RepID=UPI003C7CDBEC
MSHLVGVDLGGTKTAAALVSLEGQVGAAYAIPTPARDGPEAILDAVATLVREVVARYEGSLAPGQYGATIHLPGIVQLLGIGVGTAGVVDAGVGRVLSATDALPGWPGTDVRQGLRERLADLIGDHPVTVENDVDAHGAGEAWQGAAAGSDDVLMVTVGTGVGASVVFDGRPLRGAHHVAGELGHLPSPEAAGLRCGCGKEGHLEGIASGPALHRHYLRLGGDPAAADARAVYARAAAGDALAERALAVSARAVGRAVAGVAMVLDPAVVVVGGGLSQAGPLWWQPMVSALRHELIAPLIDLPVRRSDLGPAAGILGAARSALLCRS